MPAVLLLVVGVLLAVGAPTAWFLTHRDPALTPVGRGVAVALAQSGADGTGAAEDGPAASGTPSPSPAAVVEPPTAADSATLAAVSPASSPTPTAVSPRGTRTPGRSADAATWVGSTTSVGTSTPAATTTPTAPRTSTAARATSPAPGTVPRRSTLPENAAPTSTAATPVRPPTRLLIPAIGVDAPVGAVGIDDRGEMAIPEQVQDIGWYRYGPAPGANQGSAVMSGHVDSAQQGLGAFARLGDLEAGDSITVVDSAGRRLPYRVVGKEAFDKKTVPLAALFSRSGAPRLTLITCGGDFDSAARSYLDNIVVTAVPA